MAPLLVSVATSFLLAQDRPRPANPESAVASSQLPGSLRCRASQLIGCAIKNTNDENLGEIAEIVFDSGNRRIAYAVVAFGGALGMGDKYFAIPWRLIEVSQRGANDAPRVTLGLDAATLQAAPGFDQGQWPDLANAAWSKQVDDYYRLRREAPLPPAAGEPKDPAANAGINSAPGSTTFFSRRLGNLIGMDVVDAERTRVADVEDLVIDTKSATIDGALLSFGGVLGMGEQLALLSSSALTLDAPKNVFVFPAGKAGLIALTLPDGKCPPLNDGDWMQRGRELTVKAQADPIATDGDVIVANATARRSVPYADAYDLTKVESVEGTITTIGTVRVGDRQEERVRLRIRTTAGRELIVYAAPATFAEQEALGLRAGKVVAVTGAPATYGTQTVLVAGNIAVDGKTATLRDVEGQPTWPKD